ncbi:MAG: class I SAM-dependent methyltransferase [Candidatus Obscuribacterales bacterium]|nr:class I SAM-dependent methyltransferase [Candidatus Obscuribacterales bacterium]
MPTIDTIENRWDILYRDYPEVYDEFASVPYSPEIMDFIIEHFELAHKVVLDIGCGTGKSAFALAEHAEKVVGIEPESAMLNLARQFAQDKKIVNVEFKEGSAERLPVPDKSVDAISGITTVFCPADKSLPPFIAEALRVVRPGGKIILVNIAPGWYAGDLHDVVNDSAPNDRLTDEILQDYGFEYRDFDAIQDYGSVEKMVRTYGFIFGRATIDYIKHNQKTRVLWRSRIRYLTVG